MLTAELVRPRVRQSGSTLSIEMIDIHSPYWQQTANDLIALLDAHKGQTMENWYRALETYEGERTDYIVVRGLAKVLSDAATFTPLSTPLVPAQLREHLFTRGPVFATPQLLYPQTRQDVLQDAATEFGVTIQQVEATLFADRPATYLLQETGPEWSPSGLLARYNLELARGILYWASHMQIKIFSNYKDLWKYLKFFKLMFWAQIYEDGYLIDLDGPISPFVQSTTRYGRQFAAFLPALLLCERWDMWAAVRSPQTQTMATYALDYTSSLPTHFRHSGQFDSQLEADFAHDFEERFGDARGRWTLSREDEVLILGDTVMIPDFALTHKETEQRILIELVGFWHPDYLRRKVEKVRAAQCHHLLLLVYEGVNLAAERLQDVPGEVLYFKNKPVLKEVMATVDRMAEQVYGITEKKRKKKAEPVVGTKEKKRKKKKVVEKEQ